MIVEGVTERNQRAIDEGEYGSEEKLLEEKLAVVAHLNITIVGFELSRNVSERMALGR